MFLNVGAHIGTFVMFTNKVKKLKKTICIEASSSNVSQLMINVNLNDLKNTDIFHCAAGDREEFVEFTYENLKPGYYNGRALDLHYSKAHKNQKQGSEFIQMKKIDNIIKEHKLPYPSIILIDIDGHELLALKGMEEIFSNNELRHAIIETNKKTDDFVVEFIKKHGFITIHEYASTSTNNRVFGRIQS